MKILLVLLGTVMLAIVTLPETHAAALADPIGDPTTDNVLDELKEFFPIPGSVIARLCIRVCKNELPKGLIKIIKPNLDKLKRFCKCRKMS